MQPVFDLSWISCLALPSKEGSHEKSPATGRRNTQAQAREEGELRNAYDQKFGMPMVFEYSPKNIKLLKRALATGKDQPELIAMRKESERNVRA